MENASKALLMAGGALIAMLIIAVAVFLFNTYGQIAPSYQKKMEEIEVKKFNSNFTKFEGRKDITVQEIISIVNFVKNYEEETEIKVTVNTPFGNDLSNKTNEELVLLIKNNSNDENSETIKYYECEKITLNGPFGTVDSIKFK